MTNNKSERLSAIVDGEVLADELSATLSSLSSDEASRQCWGRYHLIGDAIRGESVTLGAVSIADRVREHIADEPAIFSPAASRENRPTWRSQWMQYAAGAAIAASVTMMAVMVVPNFVTPEQGGVSQVAKSTAPSSQAILKQPTQPYYAEQSRANRPAIEWDLGKPGVGTQMNPFFVNHKEYAPMSNMQSMLPHTSVVSYGAEMKKTP
jgi:sigma-E factor negative regulatory protein RseA